jgi:hypothetical protein
MNGLRDGLRWWRRHRHHGPTFAGVYLTGHLLIAAAGYIVGAAGIPG